MTIHCIVGGQFGSEAKGHVAAQLAHQYRNREARTVLVRVGGSNAGHSAVDDNGVVWALRQIPAAAVVDREAKLVIAQGSEISVDVLLSEIDALDDAGFNVSGRLFIDPSATIVEQTHVDQEAGSDLNARVGSTAKGIGAARADRIMRKATTAINNSDVSEWCYDTARFIALEHYNPTPSNIIVEGTQGYGLGMHTGFYPQSTSGDCRNVDLLAQIGFIPLDPSRPRDIHTWIVFRTYPIRVAGNSGALFNELTWEQLSARTDGYIQPERTTVTKKIRRIGEWDAQLASQAMKANGGANDFIHPCLMFTDYLAPQLHKETQFDRLYSALNFDQTHEIRRRSNDIGSPFAMFGTGQATAIIDHEMLEYQINNRKGN